MLILAMFVYSLLLTKHSRYFFEVANGSNLDLESPMFGLDQ